MKFLFILSQYRICEKILPVIPVLEGGFELDCLLVYQMKSTYQWPGDDDLRKSFFDNYSEYFNVISEDRECFDYSKYDLIITDDNRDTPKTNLSEIYNKRENLMVGCYHGAGEKWNNFRFIESVHGKVLDKCFVMGKSDVTSNISIPIGIPSNDYLKSYKNKNKNHILVIVNFLGNRSCPFKVKLDENFVNQMDFISLQDRFELPIIFKLKSRADEGIGGYKRNEEYLNSILPNGLDYKILCDYTDIDILVSESKIVISAPSTLSYKSIQLGIPTMLIKDSGQLGNFGSFSGLVELDKEKIKNKIDEMIDNPKDVKFIESAIEGGIDFSSTKVFVNKIKELIQ